MYGYDYGYGYDSYDYGSAASAVGIFAGVGIIMWIIGMAIAVFSIICMWKLFKKAGKPGWAAIVPIYNIIVMLEIAELPVWYIALFFVPFANIYAMFKIYIEIAHKFGKSTGFGVGMVFLSIIFIPMLAFGKAEYKGGASSNVSQSTNMYNNAQFNQPMMNTSMDNQYNSMNVNNNIPVMNDNMSNNGNVFQPIGNVDNNVNGTNIDNNVMNFNNNVVDPMNNSVFNPTNVNAVPVVPVIPNASVNNAISTSSVVESINNNVVSSVAVNPVNSDMKKTCPNCGNQVQFDAMFCNNCGNNL